MDRVCVFVDGSNFYHACKENLRRTDIHIGQFAAWLVGPDRRLVRTYYYNCLLPADHPEEAKKAQQRFLAGLQKTPYLEVRLGKLVKREDECPKCHALRQRWTEKGVDMHIGIDMLSTASKGVCDTAILVSGDGDLADAVRATKDLGHHVEVAAFAKGCANELIQVADVYRELKAADVTSLFVKT